jgi:hypothetical protein
MARRRGTIAIWLLALAVSSLMSLTGCSVEPNFDVAVAGGSNGRPLEFDVTTCGPSGVHVVTMSEPVGGSRTEYGVPIYWQIASSEGSRRARYPVGTVPQGFITTVPAVEPFAHSVGDFYDIEIDGVVVNFDPADAAKSEPPKGRQQCRLDSGARERWLIRVVVGVLIALLFFVVVATSIALLHRVTPRLVPERDRLFTRTLAASAAVAVATVVVLTSVGEPHNAPLPKNFIPRGVPKPGRLAPSLDPGQRVLARLDSVAGYRALAEKQFVAKGRYLMYVGCSGTSVQVSEGLDTPDVAYGIRTVALCNPAVAVPSSLPVTPHGSVFLGVLPSDSRRWRVTVATP